MTAKPIEVKLQTGQDMLVQSNVTNIGRMAMQSQCKAYVL